MYIDDYENSRERAKDFTRISKGELKRKESRTALDEQEMANLRDALICLSLYCEEQGACFDLSFLKEIYGDELIHKAISEGYIEEVTHIQHYVSNATSECVCASKHVYRLNALSF